MERKKQTARKSTSKPPYPYATNTQSCKIETNDCQKCGKQFVAKMKTVRETNCNDCLIAKRCKVSYSISM